jgi:Tol biopolymer transport system component
MNKKNMVRLGIALSIFRPAVLLTLLVGLLGGLFLGPFGDTPVLSALSPSRTPSVTPLSTPLSSQQVAFDSYFEGKTIAIYTVNADGSNIQRLTDRRSNNFDPAWSPDGEYIAFVSDRDKPHGTIPDAAEIYVMEADGENQHRLTHNSFDDFAPVWSPDGRTVAFVSDRDGKHKIYLMDVDGGNQRPLTAGNFPQWSSDSESIIFVSNRSGFLEIYTIQVESSNVRQLTYYEGSLTPSDPVWSPDGQSVVYSAGVPEEGSFAIYVMGADGENQRALTPINGGMYPTWSPDGRFIAFAAQTEEGIKVYIMNPDGSNVQPISPEGSNRPAWRP